MKPDGSIEQTRRQDAAWRRVADHPAFIALAVLAVSIAKMPSVFLTGRFLAEEGAVFFPNIADRGFPGGLLFIYKGTIVVLTNIAVWISTTLPLELAPYATTYLGFAAQLFVFYQLVQWGRDVAAPAPATLLLVLGWALLPIGYEVSANSTNLQWTCSISMLLLLLSPVGRIRRRLGSWSAWTLACSLTGVPSCMLAPAFLARGAVERSRVFLGLGALMAGCVLVQLGLIVLSGHGGQSGRTFEFHVQRIVLAILLRTVLGPMIGPAVVDKVWRGLRMHGALETLVHAGMVFAALACVACFTVLAVQRKANRGAVALMLATWTAVTALNMFGAFHPDALMAHSGGNRYFLYGATCMTLIVTLAGSANSPIGRKARTLGLVCILVAGILDGFALRRDDYFTKGPAWAEQVSRCRRQKASVCALNIWPAPDWVIQLHGLGPRASAGPNR